MKNLSFFFTLRKLLVLRFKALGWRIALSMIVSVARGIIWVFGVTSMHYLFDAVAEAVLNPYLELTGVVRGFLYMGSVILAEIVLNNFADYLIRTQDIISALALEDKMHRSASSTDPIIYEDSNYLNNIEKASRAVGRQASGFVWGFIELFTFYTPFFIFMTAYLYNLHPILPLIFLFIIAPIFFENWFRTKIMANTEERAAPLRRAFEHYENALCAREYLKETRQLGAFGFFFNLFHTTMKLFTREQWKVQRKMRIYDLIFRIPTVVAHIGIIVLLVVFLRDGYISIGAFAAILVTVERLFEVVYGLFQWGYFSRLPENLAFSRNLVSFFYLPKRNGAQELPAGMYGVSLQDVSFIYPGRNEKALNNISLELAPGETVALVGANGAGKSTLVKLITGLYLPISGVVKIGGIDTREISMESLFKRKSGVFQRFQQYKLTARENISISYAKKTDKDDDIRKAIARAGVNLDSAAYPQGLDTMLSREFDGVDLSGGQWQRLAIARGLYRVHDFIILDEPTAAIDPIEERMIYQSFSELAKDKTAILVTHRLGAAQIADRIIVVDDGRIAEEGRHEDLMERKGIYAKLFEAQAKWYE